MDTDGNNKTQATTKGAIVDILTVDFETYYDNEYSLSKMQTDAYILDDRFEIIGVSVMVNDGPAQWYSGGDVETVGWLKANFDWENCAVRCHNTLFDGFILAHACGIRPKLWMDTLAQGRMLRPYLPSHSLASMAKHFKLPDKGTEVVNALGKRRTDFTAQEMQEYQAYCEHDAWLCREIGTTMDEFTPLLEMKLIDMTVRMFTEPRLVGHTVLIQQLYDAEVARKQELLDSIAFGKDVIMSNDKFADALRSLGVEPPVKTSGRTGKEAYAFAKSDKEFTDLLEHPEVEVQTLVGARIGTKTTIAETRTQRFIEMSERGPLCVYLQFWGAKTTGRYSGGNKVNWQNLPARGISAGLRKAIMAPEGYKLLVGDSSNIELRTVMALAGQWDVVDKIRAGVDLYCDFASKLFGRTITKADFAERFLGKTACIAEGELVLTDYGLIPIEQVTTLHKVWDGVSWVNHAGVVYKGVKNVIEYQGLWATPDHLVHLENGTWCEFEAAADQKARISVTANAGRPVCVVDDLRTRATGRQTLLSMRLWRGAMGWGRQSAQRQIFAVQRLCGIRAARESRQVGQAQGYPNSHNSPTCGSSERPLHQSAIAKLGAVWSARRGVPVRIYKGIRRVRADLAECLRAFGNRSYREQPTLRAGELALYNAAKQCEQPPHNANAANRGRGDTFVGVAEPIFRSGYRALCAAGDVRVGGYSYGGAGSSREAEKLAGNSGKITSARVYDIVNAGPRNRFTVSGLLVHNCLGLQYGAGATRFQEMVRIASTTVPGVQPITLDRAYAIVDLYRQVHYKVVELWNRCQDVVLPDIANGCSMLNVDVNEWFITQRDGFGRPGEPGVVYHDLKYNPVNREWDYQMGRQRARIYGPKIVENLTQHAAMKIVMWQTARINQRYPVVLSVHDEAVCVVPDDELTEAKLYMEECLSLTPAWCRGHIPVACEVDSGQSYGDAK
jgi:hypothetical protein